MSALVRAPACVSEKSHAFLLCEPLHKRKSSLLTDDLRSKEEAKIDCGKAHFAALEAGQNPARYMVATSFDDVLKTMG